MTVYSSCTMSLLVVSPVLYEIGRIQAEVEELSYLWDCYFRVAG